MKRTIVLIAFVISIVVSSSFAFAVVSTPGMPNQFFGTVTINGAPAPDGASVSARINGAVVSTAITAGGKYGYVPNIFYVTDPNGDRYESTIQFFVNGVDTGTTAKFYNGASTQLNLAITVSSPSAPAPAGGSGSGGGGGGGGSGGTGGSAAASSGGAGTNAVSEACRERWLCSEWSACKDGIQTRACSDANTCGTNNNEPLSSQPCANEKTSQANAGASAASAGPTGFFLGAEGATWAGAIIGLIILGSLVYVFGKRKNSGAGNKKSLNGRKVSGKK